MKKSAALLFGSLLLTTALFARDPFMMIRFRSGQNETEEIWNGTFAMLQRYRAACDEVWFSTGIGVPPLSWHEAHAKRLAAAAEQVRSVGILPSLQFQATLGHTDEISAGFDCSAKTWGGFTGRDGTECKLISCPRQPAFLAYCETAAKLHAAWKPAWVWIDDDLRGQWHPPVKEDGCFCDTCVQAFSQQEGKEYTRKSLVDELAKNELVAKHWNRFRDESLAQVAKVITRAIHEISPDTRMGMQHGSSVPVEIFEAMADASGHKVSSRPGGGAYFDHNPYTLIGKAFNLSRQVGRLHTSPAIESFCPEIETCPRSFTCKTAHGIALESLLTLSFGMDSLSYFIMDPKLESPAWYGSTLMSELAADATLFRDYEAFNRGTFPGGIAGDSPVAFACLGIPFCPGSPYLSGHLLSESGARSLPADDVRRILSGGVLLDGAAVAVLQQRGFKKELEGLSAQKLPPGLHEIFTDDELNQGMINGYHRGGVSYGLTVESETARIVGRYENWNGEDAGIASILLETAQGARIAAFGCDGFQAAALSRNRIRQLARAADWVTQSTLPALAEDPAQCLVVPRVEKNGDLRSVTVLNTTIDQLPPLTIRMRKTPKELENAQWIALGERPVPLRITRQGDDALVTLPAVAPWNIGWIRLGE